MAARLNPEQQERTRSAIQTSQLVKRLQHYALGTQDQWGKDVVLDQGQVRAIDILLKKTLPDLTHNKHEGTGEGGAFEFVVRYED